MPANDSYIPVDDGEFDDFQTILYSFIILHTPGTAFPWGYPQARVDTLTTMKTRWDAAWLIAKNKNTRNKGDVKEKDDAREPYEKEIRAFVKEFLKNNSLITNEVKVEMGVPVDAASAERPAITNAPFTDLKTGDGCTIKFTNRVVNDGGRGSMHPDADVVEMKWVLHSITVPPTPPPNGPEQCPNTELSTKAMFTSAFGIPNAGKRLYCYSRWRNNSEVQKSGPFGQIQTIVLSD